MVVTLMPRLKAVAQLVLRKKSTAQEAENYDNKTKAK
jgi:hypothetical protein|tara:strand:- start:239 stop:349 length:111 start_codon:yes stop_codon:yes gene_type:complete